MPRQFKQLPTAETDVAVPFVWKSAVVVQRGIDTLEVEGPCAAVTAYEFAIPTARRTMIVIVVLSGRPAACQPCHCARGEMLQAYLSVRGTSVH
jgi:hypothetical protein